jgi:acetamidase/formamidase
MVTHSLHALAVALCTATFLTVAPYDLAARQTPAIHKLQASPATVAFGHYDPAKPPVLRVRSGDMVDVETLLTNSPQGLERAGIAAAEVQTSLRDIYAQVTDRGPGGHILTGPIWIEGAEPGDALEVRVLEIGLPIDYGYNGCSGFIRELCEEPRTRIYRLDRRQMTTEFAPGITIPLRPFFGSMGVAPPADTGRISSNPPWIHAGNLDNKELVVGTSLFIPVHVRGALFQIGDGHAAQGDGEVNQTAIETSLTGRIQLIVHKGMKLEWPRAETPTHWITMGMHRDLTEATRIAVRQTVAFLMEHGLSRGDAYRLTSIAIDLRITELVDGNVGVHAMIAKRLLPGGR